MGINGWELIVLLVVAILVIGPERLPQAAEQLARLVRELRRMATGARDRVREELGPEIADIDLAKLDPRQYDPRRIVREALTEDLDPPQKPASTTARGADTATSSAPRLTSPASVVATAQNNARQARGDGEAEPRAEAAGGNPPDEGTSTVPFDDEAT